MVRWYKRLAKMIAAGVVTGIIVGMALWVITIARGVPELGTLFLGVGFVLGFVIGMPFFGIYRKMRANRKKSSGVLEPRAY